MCEKYRWLVVILVLLLVSVSFAGCNAGTAGQDANAHDVVMAEVSSMPSQVQQAPQMVRDAYRFAATHADILHQIPCYCGCGAMGHGSNYDCFWQEEGKVTVVKLFPILPL